LSTAGSSDPAIVGQVIRFVRMQVVARNSDGQFKIDEWAQAIATPFSVRVRRSLARLLCYLESRKAWQFSLSALVSPELTLFSNDALSAAVSQPALEKPRG
jgi:hypothetical protein